MTIDEAVKVADDWATGEPASVYGAQLRDALRVLLAEREDMHKIVHETQATMLTVVGHRQEAEQRAEAAEAWLREVEGKAEALERIVARVEGERDALLGRLREVEEKLTRYEGAVANLGTEKAGLLARLREVEAELLEARGLYEVMRSERDRLRRDLDAKDHEVATLKGEVNAARIR